MKLISKEIFHEMLDFGLLNTNNGFKNFSITSSKKGGKRKKYYVSVPDYLKYLKEKLNARGR